MSNELVKVFNGQQVKARESDRYVNATELCKAAGREWHTYWRSKQTKGFIEALAAETQICGSDLVQISRGGNSRGGTWIHPQVVIHFAQWASPEFAVLVTEWAVKLLTTGKVELSPQDAEITKALSATIATLQRDMIEIRTAMTTLASRNPIMLPTHPGPDWTVARRIERLYPNWKTTPAQRNRIGQRAKDHVESLMKQPVHHNDGGHLIFFSHQIDHLDDAIRFVMRKAIEEGKKADMGLYEGCPPDEPTSEAA